MTRWDQAARRAGGWRRCCAAGRKELSHARLRGGRRESREACVGRRRERTRCRAAPGAADACPACTEWAGGGGRAGDGCGREGGKLCGLRFVRRGGSICRLLSRGEWTENAEIKDGGLCHLNLIISSPRRNSPDRSAMLPCLTELTCKHRALRLLRRILL